MQNRRKSMFTVILSLILACVLAAGCAAGAADNMAADREYFFSGGMSQSSTEKYSPEADMSMNGIVKDDGLVQTGSNGLQAVSTRKLITTVTMETETEHYEDLMAWLSVRVSEYGGYVEYSETSGSQSSRRYTSMKLRIPAVHLDAFLTGLAEESNVTYRSQSVKDVTLDYVDVESHKEALLVEQARLMELLEQAKSLDDLLTIESRLTQVRYELERYESQLRTYDNLVDYSTISLNIREVKVLTAPEPEGFWERVTEGFRDNLKKVTEDLTEFSIVLLSSIPTLLVWAVILILALFILRGIRKRRRERRGGQFGKSGDDERTADPQKTKKRWGKRKNNSLQEKDSVYTESSQYTTQEKKDGE